MEIEKRKNFYKKPMDNGVFTVAADVAVAANACVRRKLNGYS